MVSKNNFKNKMEQAAARTPHYGIRKLSVGVASVLISTTLYMGAASAKADTLPSTATDAATAKPETVSSSSSTQANATADNTAKTTVPATASSTDTSVSTSPNAQVSTTNTTAGATSSDKSGANSNSLVTNNVESTANTTAQTQPKPNVVTSDKANVDNQVGSNVENKATTTTDTISAPTTPKHVVRSLAAAPTTNSKELVENQDYTVSNVSLEDHKKQDDFDQDATFLHADINAKDGDAIANKEITVTFNKKEFGEFWNFKNQDLIYNDQVIGNLVGDAWGKKFKIAFNDNTKGFKDINLSLKVYLSDNPYTMRDLYTNNQAKNNEKYTVRHNYQIGSTNYYVDREATIHYVAEAQPTTQTTEQFYKPISFWYSPQEWYQLDITYYTTRDGKTYAQIGGIPGKEISYDLGLGKGFITPDTKSVTISFEPSSKYYSRDANILKISDNATFDEKTVTHRTQYDSNDLVAGFTDVYTTMPKGIDEVSNKHTYYVKDLIKLDGNTLIATDATTSTGLNNLSARGGAGTNGYVGSNDANYTVVSSDDLRKFVIDNAAKIIETRGEFLTSNSDYSNPGRIVAHNNTTGQDVYYELHNKVRVNNRNVTTPPDGTILISAGKDIPTKVYSYTSTDIPSNVDKSKLTKEVTRTINVHNPNGTVDTTVQKVTYHQTVTVAGDEVVYNNDWVTADNQSWDKVDVPQIESYKASQTTVNQSWVNVNTQNQTVDITYTANPQSIKINYVDDEKGGATVKSDTLNGKTDETVKTGITIPENYSVVGTTPSEYTFKSSGNTDITVHLKHVIDTTSEEKTVTRTIKVTDPTGKVTTIPQTAKVTRTVSTDKVTNQKTYGDWTSSSFDSYDVPTIEGYTATQSKVDTATVTGDTQNSEVNITYTANDQAIKINYIDSDNNDSVVKSDTLNGKTDQTVKTGITIPEGYTIEEQAPTDYTFKASGNADITVKLKHGTTTVTPDNPKTTGDKLPDNPSKNYPSGVGQNDLNKTVTRKVTITTPDNKSTVTNQTVTFIRNATVDEVTGNVTYGSWSENGKHTFATVNVPTVPGYTATGDVSSLTVTPDSKDTNVTINYTANEQSTQIVFVDKDGKAIDTVNVNGKTGETVDTNAKVPDKWKLVDNETIPSTVTFSADTPEKITIYVEHKIETKQLKINVAITLMRLIKYGYNINENGNYLPWINNDEIKNNYNGKSVDVGSVIGSVQYDLVSDKIVKTNDQTFKFDKILLNYPSDDNVANGGSLSGVGDLLGNTFNQMLNKYYNIHDNVKVYTSANLTKNMLAGKDNLFDDMFNNHNLVQFTFKNGKQYGSDYEIDTSTIDNSFSIKLNDLLNAPKYNYTHKINKNDDGSLSTDAFLYMPIVYQPYISRTATRTINITNPDKTVKTIKQTAEINQNVGIYKNAGGLHKDDAYITDNNWSAYTVPDIPGYTANQTQVDAVTVDGNTTDQTININYTANEQSTQITFVDEDGKTIDIVNVNGKTGETVDTNAKVPDGWKLVGNETIPSTITFTGDGVPNKKVTVDHATVTVTPDKPKTTGDKLPDNPSKNYPSGVAESDLNKNVTRTIKVTDPQGKVTTTTQTVHLTRSAMVDEVTGGITYGDWSTGSFDGYDVPTIEGYTATQSNVDTAKVTSDTKNSEVNINYTANPQSIKINYVDDGKGGATVKSDTLNGKTDETVKTGITIPENYTVVGTTLSEYTFKAKDNADITLHLKHVIDTTSEEKTITRTIKVTNPNGGVMTIPQSAKSTRTVSTDKVTGEVTYGDWSKADLDGYDVPLIEGYTASQPSVAKTTVDGSNEDNVVEINYTPNKQVISIDYVDNGKVIATQVLTGNTDQIVKTNIQSPDKDKYVLVGNNLDTYTFKAKGNEDIRVEVKHVINDSTESKDITRTIIVTRPDGKETTEVQKATVSRTVHTDAVTGAKTYDEWSKATLDKYNVPTVDGYTPSLNVVEGLEVDGNNEDSVVKVGYTANPQSIKVNYVDEDNGSSTVKTETLNGKTDQTVKTGIEIPDGYVVEGQVPTDYTFKAKDNADITVKLKHGTTTVTADNPKTTDDKLPDNPSKPYPSGVGQNDLNKDVTRTIKVTDPTGKVTTETQTVHLTRNATVDEVTGNVTYGDWTTGSFDSYDVPSVEGYTASQDKVERTPVTADSTNSEVNISYTANDQSIKINYVDNNGGTTVKSDTLNGKTDQTVKTGITIPDGYVVDGNVPTDYTFKAKDNADITVHLTHNNVTVTADKSKTTNDKLPDNPSKSYPEGVSENDLNKTVTRTIKVTDPKGKVTTTTQTVHLTRTATVDEVTGKVTYGDWTTGSFDSYDVPSVEGYTASQDKVDTATVTSDSTNSEVNISYTANNQTAKVVYVDEDNGGSTVKTDVLNGKTDETVKTGVKIPDGYVVNGQVPADYTFKAKDNADVTVKLKHGTTTVTPDKPKTTNDKLPDNPSKSYPSGVAENDLNKTVTRTIKVTDPKGKVTTTTQTVHLTRTATVDEVTGKVSYGDWTTGSFGSYDVPSVDGYTASQAKVDEAKVTADSKNSEVNITYTANDQSAKIVYVDRDNGDSIVKTDTLNGKTDQTVKTGIETPDGYVVEGQVPTDYTFKAKDNADITVHLTHNKATVTPDKPKTTADKLPNNPTKSYPDGVGQNDLNKTVTRTIKVTTPDGKTSTTTQTVHLTRTATVDEVTGKVTYSDWTTGSFDSYDVPSVDGYTASQSKVDGTLVTADSSNNEVNISYTANDQSTKIVYVDNGKVVSTQVLTGKTDQTVKTNIQSSDKDKYVVVGNNPENYTFKAKDNEDIKVEVKHVVNTFKDYKNVIRSIEVTYPNGKTEKLDQVATLERTVHKDAVTGEETYSDWSTENWDSFTAPAINGYTADKDVKETVVTGDTTETTVSIVYTANEQATKIVYVDNDKSGSIVKTDTLNGKTDQTVKTDVKVPDGYVLEGNVPDNYTFTAGDNFDIIVHLRHGIVKVTPDKPKTTADKLPDSSKTYPEGVGQDNLNKTITRTIKVTTPDGKTSTTTQIAHLIRTARVDETTGQVTYDDWTTGSFDSYDVPSVDGYTASQAKVEETKVTSDSQDSEVNISYTANKQSIKVVYVDGDNSDSTVKTDTLTGKTDETVKTGIEIPDGYEVDGQVPSEYSFKAKDNADITVHLKHSTVTVIPDLPKTTDDKLPNNPTKSYPKGVAKDDLNKTVVRTIKVTTPDGKTTTTRQTVDLNRVAVVDEVTGQVTYSKWSLGELDRYDVPVVDGYTPSQDRVNMEVATSETKDSVVEITYAPNGQSINITYVDDDKGGATVKSYILAGKTDETVKTGIEIPDGYEVEEQVPADYTFKAKDNADVTVHLKHKLDKGTETKTVSRIVKITLPDGQTKTIKQEQTLKRSKTTDLVTGDVVYGEWSKAEFDEVVAPEVDGYKPSQAKVEKETVDGNSSDQVVKITYKKVKSDVKVEAKPTVEAKHEAKVQIAPKVEAKASAKPQAKAQPKFVTTELPQTGEKQSKGTTIGAILVGLGSLLGLGALGKRKEK